MIYWLDHLQCSWSFADSTWSTYISACLPASGFSFWAVSCRPSSGDLSVSLLCPSPVRSSSRVSERMPNSVLTPVCRSLLTLALKRDIQLSRYTLSCFRLYHTRHPPNHDSSVARGVHHCHHWALLGHHKHVPEDLEKSRQNKPKIESSVAPIDFVVAYFWLFSFRSDATGAISRSTTK